MASSTIVVRADFQMKDAPDDIDAIVANLVATAEEEEPGTLVYAWFRHVDDLSRWSVIEMYKDQAALDAHLRGPRMRVASSPLADLIDFASGVSTPMSAIAAKGMRHD